MRQVLQMVLEFAVEDARARLTPHDFNARSRALQSAYNVLDSTINPTVNHSIESRQMMEAMSIADFPTYFGNIISRAFYADYPLRVGRWATYTTPDESPDFRSVERGRLSEFGTLHRRMDRGETTMDHLEESWLNYAVEEYSNAFGLSWRIIVNDDMQQVQRFPQKLLNAALRFEDTYVNSRWDNATTRAALTALGANYTAALAFTVEGIISAWEKFAARTTPDGHPLNITPRYLVAHPTKQLKAQEILAGIDVSASNSTIRATRGLLEFVPDPYLSNPAHWYLMADPSELATITVLRMRGYDRPRVYMKAPNMVPFTPGGGPSGSPSWMMGDFEHGEIEFMVHDIIGSWDDATYVGLTDYHGIFWSSGA